MIVASIRIGLQLVGLNSKFGRSISTWMRWSCRGTPFSCVGKGSEAIVIDAKDEFARDYLFPVLNAGDLATVPAVMLVVCILAGFGPAVMAARMRPADSLRYV